jgi:hypothetical protein
VSLLAARQDFEPANPTEGASALYYVPGMDTAYHYGSMAATFQARIDALKGRFAPNNQKLAIWGCGWAWLVSFAVTAGYDAYGFDASSYAVTKAKAMFPAISSRIFQRDALIATDVTAAKNDAGIHGNTRFALLVTEELLDVMSDAEIAVTLPLLRGICSSNLAHIVTSTSDVDPPRDPRVNWKDYAAWKALLSPPDVVVGTAGQVV